ncbi:CAP domain-containing protein [Paenibacillus elgii]|uniref:Serine protease n=1 Tax=Paenibacillus elgii TaxID=189691 RepID=A0A2T6FYR6_9BACL|nr:CAP domain-containing protein [Paenibacillus elgii]MCM3270144.1 CAP domain-containing protein [Paenibacillus elgii]NEN83027.1 LysM peptidoglycan-binding domain-containing protein [Paenibacillus elgii]PUA37020.1 serine protease [Paenibacillus elgii]
MNRMKKTALVSVLALTSVFGAGMASASAAPCPVTDNNTLSTISQKYGIDLSSLLKSNPQLSNPNVIWKGMIINLPGCDNGWQPTTPVKPQPVPAKPQPTTPVNTQPTTPAKPQPTTPAQQPDTGSQQGTDQSAFASQVVNLVNQERAKAGLKPLASDSALTSMALAKAKDMYTNNYFDHTSPTYGSPFDMMKSFGITFSYAGENIAKGQRSPQEVMNAWMNSEGHRQNILSPNFTKIGVAYYNGEWVQEFIAN